MQNRFYFLVCLLIITAFHNIQAKDLNSHKFTIEFDANPLAWALGVFSTEVEIKLNHSFSINPGITYLIF